MIALYSRDKGFILHILEEMNIDNILEFKLPKSMFFCIKYDVA